MHPTISEVTERIIERSRHSRARYLAGVDNAAAQGPQRGVMGCSNLAHGMAACSAHDKQKMMSTTTNIGIVTAYNDMLSAHQPYADYPDRIKAAAMRHGAMAQVAGGVPAMCDGVTQGRDGMDLSLFSRDVIAMSTAVALSHDLFDAALCLGICDKIVPGLLIGSLTFGHLPVLFVPAGPMGSGLPNKEKAAVREAYATGSVGRDELLAAESASYHSPGTCTFYGTANSNQMLMELMGLQLPSSSFVAPGTPLRDALTDAAVQRATEMVQNGNHYTPIARVVDEKAVVNGIVGLLTTGGSTNHTLHLVAIAAAAGIQINWQDFADLGQVIPLLAQVYPNGQADVNQFHAAGGLAFIVRELLQAGLLHEDVQTVAGPGLTRYGEEVKLTEAGLHWQPAPQQSRDRSVLREATAPFQSDGGLRVLQGPLGQAVVKVSAVQPQHRKISAPARVFRSQQAFTAAFEAGELQQDLVAVVTHQGPAANGMPELHKLSPYLGTLQNQGFKVALLTDGRMSGASGKVLAAIQVTPEAAREGAIGLIQDGDVITIDADQGTLAVDADLASRSQPEHDLSSGHQGTGRELFGAFRDRVSAADQGASVFSAI